MINNKRENEKISEFFRKKKLFERMGRARKGNLQISSSFSDSLRDPRKMNRAE
jgi:hypothetical protein